MQTHTHQPQITVRIKTVYGRESIYPVCERANLFTLITGRKTLNDAIDYIKQLGYTINVETPKL